MLPLDGPPHSRERGALPEFRRKTDHGQQENLRKLKAGYVAPARGSRSKQQTSTKFSNPMLNPLADGSDEEESVLQ